MLIERDAENGTLSSSLLSLLPRMRMDESVTEERRSTKEKKKNWKVRRNGKGKGKDDEKEKEKGKGKRKKEERGR